MPRWGIDLLATAPVEETTSGLSRGVWELSASLAERGHRVRVLYPSESLEPSPNRRGVVGVPVPLIGVRRRPFGRDIAVGQNASRLLDPTADLVIGNDEKAGALTLPGGAKGRPVFGMFVHDVSVHTFDTLRPLEPKRGVRQSVGNWLDRRTLVRLEGKALRNAKAVVVGSELNRRLVVEHYAVPAAKLHLLPHGVPDPMEVGSKEEARLALKVPADVPMVAFVGRTPERQGLPMALEAFRRVRVFFPGARFLVVGTTTSAEPGVMPMGVVDEMTKARVLRAADVFLFPARYEGFGLAPREAMRYGVATIVSRHVPLDDVRPKEDVRVVETEEAGDYASELAEMFADPALRRKIGDAGKAYADQFSYAKMAERFEGIFAPLLG
jgi:glycosyltransferase involved in cell wall biosynthesis